MISVLLIDDSPEERELISDMVYQRDATTTVTACAGGEDGVAQAKAHIFDCVLLDLRLDGEDGLEVLADLRLARPNLPVIVLTGQGSEQAATDAFLAGAAYYLSKNNLIDRTLWTAIDRVMQFAKVERELKSKREALERSNRLDAVGQLAAGIAHDFNNQLGALRYCVEFLKSSAATDASKEKIRTALKVIEDSKNLASRLIALSRQGDLMATSVSLTDVMEDLRTLAAATVTDSVTLDIVEPEADIYSYFDGFQFLNVLLNLILNADDAIKANDRIGTITVTARRDAGQVRVSVQDNGCGMPQGTLAKCTDPFFTTKKDRNGTGLGLAMAQSFVKDNSGELLMYSTEGEGTEIIVVLPVGDKPSVSGREAVSVPDPVTSDARILVVEDQLILAMMTKEIIENHGYDVDLVTSGEKALAYLDAHPKVDVLITDINMPAMNGFELAQKVRQMKPTVQILYLTGYSDNPEHHSEDVLGPILQKPVEPNVLLASIAQALS